MTDPHGVSQESSDDVIGYEVSSREHFEHALRGLTCRRAEVRTDLRDRL
jgi:hypothetical protein